jgi:replicative DNA helicase
MNFAQIRALARKWRAQHTDATKPAFIVVDYLTLIDTASDGRRDANREQAVAAISRGLKHLAKELQVPIMALAQINRGPESRADKRPTPADLRESGSLEADADMVALLYRDEVYNAETQAKGIAEVIIAAHRHGGTGVIRLRWRGEYTRFENLDARE